MTKREKLMVRYLRVLVQDDDAALEVIDGLNDVMKQWLEEVAELAGGDDSGQ